MESVEGRVILIKEQYSVVELCQYKAVLGVIALRSRKIDEKIKMKYEKTEMGRPIFTIEKEVVEVKVNHGFDGKISKMTEMNAIVRLGRNKMARVHRKYWDKEY